jgi:uncharacterized Tic20 family protein
MNFDRIDQPGDRLMAVASHIAGILPLFGMMVPAAVWLLWRRANPALARQALEALSAQALLLAALLLLPCLGGLLAAGLAPQVPRLSALLQFLSRVSAGAILLGAWVVFAFAAYRALLTGAFTYPLVGTAIGRPTANDNTER